jgi:hypothetical protein
MTVYVADAHAHVQRLVSVLKMATVLEECVTEEHCSVVPLLWAKGHDVKDINEKIIPVFGGKDLSRKVVHNCVEELYQGNSKVADDARISAKVAETIVKRLLVSMHLQSYETSVSMLVEDMSRSKCSFQFRISHVLYPFVIYLLTLTRRREDGSTS